VLALIHCSGVVALLTGNYRGQFCDGTRTEAEMNRSLITSAMCIYIYIYIYTYKRGMIGNWF